MQRYQNNNNPFNRTSNGQYDYNNNNNQFNNFNNNTSNVCIEQK